MSAVVVVLVGLGHAGSGADDADDAAGARHERAHVRQHARPDAARQRDGHHSGAGRTGHAAAPRPPASTYLVSRVVDGDTIELGTGQAVRLVGIDTPERGQCGYDQATRHMVDLVLGKRVVLRRSDEDTDRYGRLLRYVDVPAAESGVGRVVDAGLDQIRSGLAIARYDSRDGYGYHPREPLYVRSDAATARGYSCPRSQPVRHSFAHAGSSGSSGDCMAGYSPCLPVVADLDCADIGHPVSVTGSDPYRLDGDGDGTGCD